METEARKKPLTILVVNHLGRWTSSKSYSVKQALWLAERGHRVFYAQDKLKTPTDERAVSLPHEMRADYATAPFNNLTILKQALNLADLVRKHGVRIVHTHLSFDHDVALLASRLWRLDVAVFRTKHYLRPLSGGDRLSHRIKYGRRTARTFTTCDVTRELLVRENGIDPECLATLYEGVDCRELHPDLPTGSLREAWAIDDSSPVIGMVASCRPDKDHLTFLRAAKILADDIPGARFVIAALGGRDDFAYLKGLIADLNLTRHCVVTGYRPDVPNLLALFDVGVVTSTRSDGAGRIVIEYHAAGTPVVVTTVGAYPELIDEGVTGFAVPPQSPAVTAAAIRRILASRTAGRGMSRAARQRALTLFDKDRFTASLESAYEAALINLFQTPGLGRAVDRPQPPLAARHADRTET